MGSRWRARALWSGISGNPRNAANTGDVADVRVILQEAMPAHLDDFFEFLVGEGREELSAEFSFSTLSAPPSTYTFKLIRVARP